MGELAAAQIREYPETHPVTRLRAPPGKALFPIPSVSYNLPACATARNSARPLFIVSSHSVSGSECGRCRAGLIWGRVLITAADRDRGIAIAVPAQVTDRARIDVALTGSSERTISSLHLLDTVLLGRSRAVRP